jgi:hypothetical protein
VRTMKSDLASMAASGGGSPQFQNVTIAAVRPTGLGKSGNKGNLLVIVITLLAVLVVLAVIYFGYQALSKNQAIGTSNTTSQTLP